MSENDPDYTPTTDQVRDVYHLGLIDIDGDGFEVDFEAALAQFDRWLAGVKSEARKEALREAVEVLRGEGEPGHAGEFVSVNHAQELIQDLAEDN